MIRSATLFTLFALFACASQPTPSASAPVELSPAEQIITKMAQGRFDELGDPVLNWDSIPSPLATKAAPHRLLVVPVEFSDKSFVRFAGDPDQPAKIQAHYQEQLFDDEYAKQDTLSHYFAVQSAGKYHLTGQVLEPVKLDDPLSVYGRPTKPKAGDWRNDGEMEFLIQDALAAAKIANPDFDWNNYDLWDPTDHDEDGILDESDGYIDHLVMIYAGKGQASCQLLRGLNRTLNPNVDEDVLMTLSPAELACADRIWPHRSIVSRNEGKGPVSNDTQNALGGIPFTDNLWARDYNMQSEYTESATFIHEFGHSIGLPDVYASSSNNSTGMWEVMSSTSSPSPQNMSAWSRQQLGWDAPLIITPPTFGGEAEVVFYLGDTVTENTPELTRSAMVMLPPKIETIDLGERPSHVGIQSLYSGKGNDMSRSANLLIDLTKATDPTLSFDTRWDIEGGWDFAYIEVKTDDGWLRIRPTEATMMPAEHGHDGPTSLPGLTGVSGDFDGDGKNESMEGCDPNGQVKSGDEANTNDVNPCEVPSWVHVVFDLSPWMSNSLQIRVRYFTDGAAVEDGIVIDNVSIPGLLEEDFEGPLADAWDLDGWVVSAGHHEVLVPHYYMLEFRDPQREASDNYDHNLAKGSWSMFQNPETKEFNAIHLKPAAGVVGWYFNGGYSWSENDPSQNGAGLGYLLAIDANPNEISLPGFGSYLQGDPQQRDTHYDVTSEEAQAQLTEAYYTTACFMRDASYMPATLDTDALQKYCPMGNTENVTALKINNKPAMYSYTLTDELPGEARAAFQGIGELTDMRKRGDTFTYSLRNRSLRYYHTLDNAFRATAMKDAIEVYAVRDGALVKVTSMDSPVTDQFNSTLANKWLNPKLPFGGVSVPDNAALQWTVEVPDDTAPASARAKVTLRWTE
jgi:immune inhibitor A